MIGILLEDCAFEQDIRELLMAFYPGETFVHEEQGGVSFYVECKKDEAGTGYRLDTVSGDISPVYAAAWEADDKRSGEWEDYQEGRPVPIAENDRGETKNRIKRRLYYLLRQRTGRELPWGTLTGIRPTKIAITRLESGETRTQAACYMKDTYLTSDEKIQLTVATAEHERKLLADVDYQNGHSLYVGIPFCPTTCLYCSFTSYPIGRWKGRTQLYLDALYREMDYVADLMAKPGPDGRYSHLDTVYIGGGTPTALSAEDLDQLLTKLEERFALSTIRELTVEAGRPDSITREKFQVLRNHRVTRISINPQTMKQETLDIIGRRHTVGMVRDCFHMAREMGFDNINMDLIVGLPGEGTEDVRQTMEAVKELDPDSITVHSLAIKRASALNMYKDRYENLTIQNTQEMIDLTAAFAGEMGMEPYYLYRQKNMAGNFENVGYAKPGKACLYNILIMEEKQTITACGAGTTTKVIYPEENRRERVENVKDVEQYISRIDEMIERKKKLFGDGE